MAARAALSYPRAPGLHLPASLGARPDPAAAGPAPGVRKGPERPRLARLFGAGAVRGAGGAGLGCEAVALCAASGLSPLSSSLLGQREQQRGTG